MLVLRVPDLLEELVTTLRLAQIQERAQRTIARADTFGAAVAAFVADIYASELVAAESDEHQREIAQRATEPQADTAVDTPSWLLSKESLRTSAIFLSGEVKRLTEMVDRLTDEMAQMRHLQALLDGEDGEAGMPRIMTQEQAQRLVKICMDEPKRQA